MTNMNQMQQQVIFFEPNPFASRLHVLEALISGADIAGLETTVLMPERESGFDLEEFARNVPPHTRLHKSGTHNLAVLHSKVDCRRLIRMVRLLMEQEPTGARIVLTAPDDFVPNLWWLAPLLRFTCGRNTFFLVRYRVADLHHQGRRTLKGIVKKVYYAIIQKILNASVVVLDERIPENDKLRCIPDPWEGPFGEVDQAEARTRLGSIGDGRVVGLVGRQDVRKGFDVAVRALLELKKTAISDIRIVIVGAVDEAFHEDLSRLGEAYGEKITHIQSYISDSDLALLFTAVDVILLPYHTQFTSSSGVLVRAAASGTPVVASDHGLVGWRTRAYKLGETFEYPNAQQLAKAIEATLTQQQHDPESGLQYARSSTSRATAAVFSRIIAE